MNSWQYLKFHVSGRLASMPVPCQCFISRLDDPNFSHQNLSVGTAPSFYKYKVTLAGEGAVSAGGVTHRLPPGAVLLAKFPSKDCRLHYPEPGPAFWHGITFEFYPGDMEAYLDGMIAEYGVVYEPDPTVNVVPRLLALHQGRPNGGVISLDAFEGTSLIHLLLGALQKPSNMDNRRRPNMIGAACDYVDAHLTESLTVTELANHLGVSRGHLTVRFKEKLGLSPLTYLNTARIRRACLILEEQELSCKEVAAQLGIASNVQFHRLFKRVTGMTPTEFRRAGNKLEIIKAL